MDLTACWLTLSMLSPMIFSKRLQFVYTTPMTFCRHNRKSNIFVLAARGPVEGNENLDDLDYNQLLLWVKETPHSLLDALDKANMDSLKAVYKRCLIKGAKRTTTQ